MRRVSKCNKLIKHLTLKYFAEMNKLPWIGLSISNFYSVRKKTGLAR